MNSPHQREQLPDLLGDALDAETRARVEAHLRECPQCARELRQLQQVHATLASLPAAPVPASVRANVRAALREKPRRQWALPFALSHPSRQLAWGGVAFVGAIGLMLLARPSLQNDDAFSRSAPVSETEMATRSAQREGTPQNERAAQSDKTTSSSRAPIARKPVAPATKPAPKSIEQLPQLPAPVAPTNPQPRREVAQGETAPAFDFPAPPAPIASAKTQKPTSRPAPPAATNDSTPTKSAQKHAPKATTKPRLSAQANQTQPQRTTENAPSETESTAPEAVRATAPEARSMEPSALAAPPAPISPPSALSADASAGSRGDENTRNSETPRDNKMARNARSNTSSLTKMPANTNAKMLINTTNWTGGQIRATLAPRANAQNDGAAPPAGQTFAVPKTEPLVLTIQVAKPIGDARLIVLAPAEEFLVWRGALDEQPAKIELSPQVVEKANLGRGQKLRARLEQIDGEGNPKSSSTFETVAGAPVRPKPSL